MREPFSKVRGLILLPLVVFFVLMPGLGSAEDGVFTLWPLVDYRYSSEADFHSLKFLGPIFKYERNGPIRQRAVRPFYYRTDHLDEETSTREILYPVSKKETEPGQESYHLIHLWNDYILGSGEEEEDVEITEVEEGYYRKFSLFPLVFYRNHPDYGRYFAIFPLGGKLQNRFRRDEIRFFMFPFYGRTERDGTTTRNFFWPIYANIQGENETGNKLWPLWGASEKTGVYRKQFFLWPFFFDYDLKQDTEAPETFRAFFPFYVYKSSPKYQSTYAPWPFFSHIVDVEKDDEEWNFPWPLFRITNGSHKQSRKYLPFYADEKVGDYRKRWILWPIYKIEELRTTYHQRRRDRILFFLISNMEEKNRFEPIKNKKRIAFWPFFTYEKKRGVSDFYFFSIAEPFFPENEPIARIWGPLWRIYQHRYDENRDSELSSFLWNLYWKERRGDDIAWEFLPLIRYQHESGKKTDLKILKGLFRYRSNGEEKTLNFFYLPWGINWGKTLQSL